MKGKATISAAEVHAALDVFYPFWREGHGTQMRGQLERRMHLALQAVDMVRRGEPAPKRAGRRHTWLTS